MDDVKQIPVLSSSTRNCKKAVHSGVKAMHDPFVR